MAAEYPKYHLIVDGESKFYSFGDALVLYDCGFRQVRFGTQVLLEDGSTRAMTDEDRARISEAADEYSASK